MGSMGKLKCTMCKEEILGSDVKVCPYCGGTSLVRTDNSEEYFQTRMERIGLLEKAGRFEYAANAYEELGMWEKAIECRKMAETSSAVSANSNIAKVASISMECPHCGVSQPIVTKSEEATCQYCRKNYFIPKKILELL